MKYRVASRYLLGKLIQAGKVDVPTTLHKMEQEVAQLATDNDMESDLPRMKQSLEILSSPTDSPAKTEEEDSGFFRTKIYDYMLFPRRSYNRLRRLGAWEMFLGLLEQYELPPAIRKKVERCSRFYAKTRVNSPDRKTALAAFEKMLAAYREHIAIAKEALSRSAKREEGGATTGPLKAGPFQVVNTGGFDDATMEECARVVEKAAQLLQSKGLGKVCYGEVLISKTIGRNSNVLAFYVLNEDQLFVRANLKGKDHDAVRHVLHELGHRLQHKFLQHKESDIAVLWATLKRKQTLNEIDQRKQMGDVKPKPGDTIEERGKTYVVDGVGYRRGPVVNFHLQDDPKSKAYLSLEAYAKLKGLLPPKKTTDFVTDYAATSPGENFAEMVSFYCLDKLPPEQVEMLEEVTKR